MEASQTIDPAHYKDWPHKGDESPQPWDLRGQGVPLENISAQVEAGPVPNVVTPVRVRHSHAILAVGAQGPEVGELARRLHVLGYATSIGTGTNPYSVLTDDVLGAVDRFREDFGVLEDPSGFGGAGAKAKAKAAAHVGPWTWEAVIRASERVLAEL
jgi:peptidoglycan hydrolase-like protein with peptidoglycan-binding domain